ncbi:chitoporin ChiP [Erwinia tasmaniensis]|uniref:chitoporin ChiP n=1 Tax=Erwinia tasmaniensis TaxID=338565 RepID=UPI003A4DEB59
MGKINLSRNILLCLIFIVSISSPKIIAAGFIDDSALSGAVYYWQRHRERRNLEDGSDKKREFERNLHHSTFNANLDFSSGYAANIVGIDMGIYGAQELSDKSPAAPNEIAFSNADSRWQENWSGDRNGIGIYKAALKIKHDNYWLRGGYIQPEGQTLLASHWSFMPGTYRGIEIGGDYNFGEAGALAISWMWSDRYKAPWYQTLYEFRKADGKTEIAWLHSIGAKYNFNNNLIIEAAFGQSAHYINQYFSKVSYPFPFAGSNLNTTWQFYGAEDKEAGGTKNRNDVYDGLAWLQALTLSYKLGAVDLRLEGSLVKAEGNQGYFLQRMTPGYASSNGRLDLWWDSRSDFNADGEKALFAGVMVDLSKWRLPGWSAGTSYAWGWGAKPTRYTTDRRLKESAWNLDLLYTVQAGRAKGALFKLHFTRYDNHSDIPSWSGGYGNIFQDERDVKFMAIVPFTLR